MSGAGASAVRVIVTRPAAQAADWVRQLRGHGLDAVALPLIGIAPAADSSAVVESWRTLALARLVVFVSPNAAEQFFALGPPGIAWPGETLAGSPGPGTTRLLLALGVPSAQIVEPAGDAAQFDSESLWQQLRLRDWAGAPVLIVRGDGGRDWLADTLRAHGARVEHLSAYRRETPPFDAAAAALLGAALAAPAAHLWFFSSSEAIDNLAGCALLPPAPDWSLAQAVVTHPRIAARARRLGFARVAEARPALDAVVACIQSIRL